MQTMAAKVMEKVMIWRGKESKNKDPRNWGPLLLSIVPVHGGGVRCCAAVDEPTFIACMFLSPAIV